MEPNPLPSDFKHKASTNYATAYESLKYPATYVYLAVLDRIYNSRDWVLKEFINIVNISRNTKLNETELQVTVSSMYKNGHKYYQVTGSYVYTHTNYNSWGLR
jgi:hypothetical protein